MVAPRILWRYILREVVLHSLLGLLVFSLVFVVQNMLGLLRELLAAEIGLAGMLKLAGFVLPSYLGYAVSTALLFGVLLTFGRMSADGELVAIRAAGVSVPRLLPPVVAVGVLAAALNGYLLFELEPQSRVRLKSLVRELGRSARLVEAGRFRALGSRTLYVGAQGDESCPLRGLLVADLSDAPRPVYISARCGAIEDGSQPSGLALELTEGSIHFSEAETERYRRVRFDSMRVELDLSAYLKGGKKGKDFTFGELLELDREFRRGGSPEIRGGDGHATVRAQLHRRVAFPLAAVFLSVLAVPLGIRPLRAGRSAGALTAIGVMALYWCLFSVGELAATGGWIPAWLGIWTPNALVLALSGWLLRRTIRGDT